MCTFHDEAAVTVCDVAISRVRSDLEDVFPGAVTFTHVEDQGTLVQADPAATSAGFGDIVRRAIAAVQGPQPEPPAANG